MSHGVERRLPNLMHIKQMVYQLKNLKRRIQLKDEQLAAAHAQTTEIA